MLRLAEMFRARCSLTAAARPGQILSVRLRASGLLGTSRVFAKTTDGTRRGAFRANPDVESTFLESSQSAEKV